MKKKQFEMGRGQLYFMPIAMASHSAGSLLYSGL
jgi:hypothetical protein